MSMFLECAVGVRVLYLLGKTLHVKEEILGCSLKKVENYTDPEYMAQRDKNIEWILIACHKVCVVLIGVRRGTADVHGLSLNPVCHGDRVMRTGKHCVECYA